MISLHPEIVVKDGQQFALLPYGQFLQVQAALARLEESRAADTKFGGFYDNLSAAEHSRRQTGGKIPELKKLVWPMDPADWEGFEEAVNEWRHGKDGE